MSSDSPFNAGWVIAIAVSTWGIILRAVLGYHVKAADKLEARLKNIESQLALIDLRLNDIEGRSHRIRKGD
jgi:hypothetical protein